MISVNQKVIVSVDNYQKDSCIIEGHEFRLANRYEKNFRLKAPTIAYVVTGNELLNKGDILLCHHNLYYLPSPYHLEFCFFSVPFSKVLFAKILQDGELLPICGNILGERVQKKYKIPLPPEQRESYTDRIVVTNPGYTRYKKGQMLLTRPSAPYNISYIWNGEQKEVTKISEDMVCAIVAV